MNHFSLAELCQLTEFSNRTIRFYIQKQLVDSPDGVGRGAYYTQKHLEQLLEIKKWQDAGLSLERIKELLFQPVDVKNLPPTKTKQAGSIEVLSHIHISHGVTLVVNPLEAGLSTEQTQKLAAGIIDLLENLGDKK